MKTIDPLGVKLYVKMIVGLFKTVDIEIVNEHIRKDGPQ